MTTEISPIRAALNEMDCEFMLLEPATYDAAIVGLVSSFGSEGPVVCYDTRKIIAILMEGDDGMDEEEAMEFFDFNIAGAYVGAATPVFLDSVKTILTGEA